MHTRQLIAAVALVLLSVSDFAVGQQARMTERMEPLRQVLVPAELNSMVPGSPNAFVILRPVDNYRIGLNTAQAIVVLWLERGTGADGRNVTFETTFGDLSAVTARTDRFGVAVVFLRSAEEGAATVTAQGGGQSAAVPVTFTRMPTAEETYRSAGRDIPLTIFQDRIGVQARSGVAAGRILAMAAGEGMEVRQVVGRGIYELEFTGDYSLDSLQQLARRLETSYAEDIARAGIVVRTGPEKAPMLLTGQVLIRFEEAPDPGQADAIREEFHLATLDPVSEGAELYVADVQPEYQWDIFRIARKITDWDDPAVRFAHPNFVIRTRDRQGGSPTADVPCTGAWPSQGHSIDPYYCQQWHHDNRGLANGVIDADIDTPEAWFLTEGTPNRPRVAIIDSAFWPDHPDLKPNLWRDSDDTPGRSFYDNDHKALLNSTEYPNSHGTSVAGIVGAVAHNQEVGRGVCPKCELLLIRNAASVADIWKTFDFAVDQKAQVVSNSWGIEEVFDTVFDAIKTTADANIPVVFAAESVVNKDRCADVLDLSSIDEHVIAVSSSTYLDDRTPSGYGNCIDVLAPSRRNSYNGIVTTAVSSDPWVTDTANFGGTSAAAPMVSGTIGLMLSVNPGLGRIEIQRALQDTADKIDPDAGAYDAETGFSQPGSGAATHAYGRINAFEAVSLVAPFDAGAVHPAKRGRAGMDLILRDHALDWGNTERPSCELFTPGNPRAHTSVIRSVDIKLDAEPFQQVEPTPQGFLKLAGEEPVPGKAARVYVRVRNRGPATVPHAWVKLHWTLAFPLPTLRQNFWAQLPDDAVTMIDPQAWNPLRTEEIETVVYSGPSAAGCPDRSVPACLPGDDPPVDRAQIVVFDLVPPDGDMSGGGRLSLLAVLHSEHDPALPKLSVAPPLDFNDPMTATVWDNNVALWVADPGGGATWCPF